MKDTFLFIPELFEEQPGQLLQKRTLSLSLFHSLGSHDVCCVTKITGNKTVA